MAQVNLTTISIPGLTQIIKFFGKFRFFGLTHGSNRCGDNTHHNYLEETSRERLDCGGYNEAFIMQHWAGYNPHH